MAYKVIGFQSMPLTFINDVRVRQTPGAFQLYLSCACVCVMPIIIAYKFTFPTKIQLFYVYGRVHLGPMPMLSSNARAFNIETKNSR